MSPEFPPTRSTRSTSLFAAGCLTVAIVMLFMLRPIRVAGSSMEPTLQDGDVVLVWSGPGWRRSISVGTIVVAGAPDSRRIGVRPVIKRIAERDEAAATPHWKLVGDNPVASRDSREYGTIAESRIEGVVILRVYPRPGGL